MSQLSLTTSAWLCLQHSRNLGPAFSPIPGKNRQNAHRNAKIMSLLLKKFRKQFGQRGIEEDESQVLVDHGVLKGLKDGLNADVESVAAPANDRTARENDNDESRRNFPLFQPLITRSAVAGSTSYWQGRVSVEQACPRRSDAHCLRKWPLECTQWMRK